MRSGTSRRKATTATTAFIVFGNTIYATSDKVTGIKPPPAPHEHGGLTGELWWNVEEWGKSE